MSRIAFLEQYSPVASKSINNSSSLNETKEGTPNLSTAERNLKVVFYCCFFLLGSLGNAMVIVVLKGKRKRTINDYFILNLAVADLTFLWLSLPFYTYELFQPFNKNSLYCKLIWPMMSLTLSVSIFTLSSMAIERCRGITNPLQPRIKLQATLIWIILIWIFAFSTIVPLMIVARPEGVFCAENWLKNYYRQTYTAVLFALQYGIPLFVIVIAYLKITICLIKSRLPMLTTINSKGEVIRHKTRGENVQIIRTLAVIVILFMACMLPNQIAWLLFDFGGDSYKELSEAFWTCAEALMYLHACVNSIVYGSLTRQFRRGYIRFFRYVFCFGKANVDDSTGVSENQTRDRHSRPKRKAGVLYGSLRFRKFSENTKTTRLIVNSSPIMSTSEESINRSASPSPGSSPVPGSASIEMLLRRTQAKETLLTLSFTNPGIETSDDDGCQETKL
ncbi:neuropeptide FF receptor 1-like [Stylophora pistillata]|uniref:neuropeptide FF receptor 1-like n=1 Tax=Stylophora pistillata TaxID=50429 RepID=UPI000C040BE9|nr:neuropeptide FF receptor 1-like [Stylophora pistillata]